MMRPALCLSPLALLLLAAPLPAADAPRVRLLETQGVWPVTYFRVRFDAPKDLYLPEMTASGVAHGGEAVRRALGRLPRLTPQDRETTAVYYRLALPLKAGPWALEFVGKVAGRKKTAGFVLTYPSTPAAKAKGLLDDPPQARAEVALTWVKEELGPPADQRDARWPPPEDDLEGQWAEAQALHFAALEARAPEFGFFASAREATGRKYAVPSGPLMRGGNGGEAAPAQLYQLTTGATALTESLALRRLANPAPLDAGKRTVAVKSIRGIDIAEHPWEKMMAGKKPAPEPLARLVPHDNYYLTVHSLKAFAEAWDLIDLWGGNVLRPVQLHDRDHGIRRRYETQLCLPTAELAKAVGPKLLRGAALTGNDIYWQEGSDVTVLLDVTDKAAFLKAQAPFVARARKASKWWKEEKGEYRGVAVVSFTTPRREVSLHRAVVGDVIVCSNSAAALRRVLDVHAERGKALADSLDFQYMRTVFVRDAKQEDGFAFLPDAFVRGLVGPAGKIKQKRRLEARAALTAATHAALFVGWEEGKLPADHKELLDAMKLKPEAFAVPEGDPVTWDSTRQQAVSEAYNTLAFSTPLVELLIDKVTAQEQKDYEAFRTEYLKLWRQFFDPVGIRFTLGREQVRVETYILPLIASNGYDDLRGFTGTRLTGYDPARLPAGTLGQVLLSLPEGLDAFVPGVGDWFAFHLDGDGAALDKWADLLVRYDLNPRGVKEEDFAALFWQMPITLAVGVKDADKFSKQVRELWEARLKGGKLTESKYKGVVIKKAPLDAKKVKGLLGVPGPAALYHAVVDGGYYLSWREDSLQRRIDALLARKEKPAKKVPVNAALYLGMPTGKGGDAVRKYLEWQTHTRALASCAAWQGLYGAGAVAPGMSAGQRDAAALRLLGYVPVSPDGTAFTLTDREVGNARHGSPRRPTFQGKPSPQGPTARLLDQLRGVRVDLRFREDGVHTVLTIERKAAE